MTKKLMSMGISQFIKNWPRFCENVRRNNGNAPKAKQCSTTSCYVRRTVFFSDYKEKWLNALKILRLIKCRTPLFSLSVLLFTFETHFECKTTTYGHYKLGHIWKFPHMFAYLDRTLKVFTVTHTKAYCV